jgi:rubrerythrin
MATELVDAGRATIGDLLVMGIQLEAAAQHFYEGLAEMFTHCPQVAEFWRLFATDEMVHGAQITKWREAASADRLAERADVALLEAGRRLLVPSVQERLGEVRNLDDAYEMAHDLETSETNTIFRLFITEFSQDKRIVMAMMRHLDEHVERLMAGLPTEYAARARRVEVEALRG